MGASDLLGRESWVSCAGCRSAKISAEEARPACSFNEGCWGGNVAEGELSGILGSAAGIPHGLVGVFRAMRRMLGPMRLNRPMRLLVEALEIGWYTRLFS
jgi:hypothetical protein